MSKEYVCIKCGKKLYEFVKGVPRCTECGDYMMEEEKVD